MIAAYDFIIEGLIHEALKKKKNIEVPAAPRMKVSLLEEIYKKDETILDNLEFYLLLRKINMAEYTRAREFRRHVTMTAFLEEDKKIDVNIDIIHEYYEKIKKFVDYIAELSGVNG